MSKKRPRSPWKQQLEAERLRAIGEPRGKRQATQASDADTRDEARQARFGPRS